MAKRVLIVDDSALVLAASRHVLTQAGYEVETRNSVEEVNAKPTTGFDLILIDVQMPELFGDDVAAVLRLERDVRTPIYLFSTLPEAELRERVKDARIDGFIQKDADRLLDQVREILGSPTE